VRILLDAGAPIPKQLWDADLPAEVLLARLGVDPGRGAAPV
jgi:hypothetical protein